MGELDQDELVAPPEVKLPDSPGPTGPTVFDFQDALNLRRDLATERAAAESEQRFSSIPVVGRPLNIFTKGFLRGLDQTHGLFHGASGAVRSLVGDKAGAVRSFEAAQEQFRQAEENAAEVFLFAEEGERQAFDSVGSFATWATEVAGELLPSIVQSVAGAVIGGATGAAAVPAPDPTDVALVPAGAVGGVLATLFGKRALKEFMEEMGEELVKDGLEAQLAKKVAREMAEEHSETIVRQGMNKIARRWGGAAGVTASTAMLEGGGMWVEGVERGIDAPMSALGLGLLSGATEAFLGIGPSIIKKVVGGIGKRELNKTAREFGVKAAAELLWKGAKQMPGEGFQEFLQEFIATINMEVNDPEFEITSQESFERWVEAAAKGMVGGFVFGGGMAAVDSTAQGFRNKKARQVVTNPQTLALWILQNPAQAKELQSFGANPTNEQLAVLGIPSLKDAARAKLARDTQDIMGIVEGQQPTKVTNVPESVDMTTGETLDADALRDQESTGEGGLTFDPDQWPDPANVTEAQWRELQRLGKKRMSFPEDQRALLDRYSNDAWLNRADRQVIPSEFAAAADKLNREDPAAARELIQTVIDDPELTPSVTPDQTLDHVTFEEFNARAKAAKLPTLRSARMLQTLLTVALQDPTSRIAGMSAKALLDRGYIERVGFDPTAAPRPAERVGEYQVTDKGWATMGVQNPAQLTQEAASDAEEVAITSETAETSDAAEATTGPATAIPAEAAAAADPAAAAEAGSRPLESTTEVTTDPEAAAAPATDPEAAAAPATDPEATRFDEDLFARRTSELQEAMPGVKVTPLADVAGWTLTFADGREIKVEPEADVPAPIVPLMKWYGLTEEEARAASPRGFSGLTVPKGAKVTLSDGSIYNALDVAVFLDPRRSRSTTARHEALHVAKLLGLFDTEQGKKVWAALVREYGGDNVRQTEENIARAREEWSGPSGLWEMIRAFFNDLMVKLGRAMDANQAMAETFNPEFWQQIKDGAEPTTEAIQEIRAQLADARGAPTGEGVAITVAPLRTDTLESFEASEIRKRTNSLKMAHLDRVFRDITEAFGVDVLTAQEVVGGWRDTVEIDQKTGVPKTSLEVPIRIEINADPETAEMIAGLIAASAPDLQNAAFVWKPVAKSDPLHNAYRLSVEVADARKGHEMATRWLDENPESDFTYDPSTRIFEVVLVNEEGAPSIDFDQAAGRFTQFVEKAKQDGQVNEEVTVKGKTGFAVQPDQESYGRYIAEARRRARAARGKKRTDQLNVANRAKQRVDRHTAAKATQAKAQDAKGKQERPTTSVEAIIEETDGDKYTVIRDFSKFLDSRFKKLNRKKLDKGTGRLPIRSPKTLETLIDNLVYDYLTGLSEDGAGTGWYDDRVIATLIELQKIHPEIDGSGGREDEISRAIFFTALAATSQGASVGPNFRFAESVYQQWKDSDDNIETRVIPTNLKFNDKTNQINQNLAKARKLIEEKGIDWYIDFMDKEVTGGYLKGEIVEPFGITFGQVNVKDTVRGNRILGAKIGSFFNNLRQRFDTVTMDLWFTRTMYRYLGETAIPITDKTTQEQLAEFVELLPDAPRTYGLDVRSIITKKKSESKTKYDERVLRAALDVFNGWSNGNKKEGIDKYKQWNDGAKLEKLARAINKRTNMRGVPQNVTHRRLFEAAVKGAKTRLEEMGFETTEADIQAVVWFVEKTFFDTHGIASDTSKPADYLDAVMALRNKMEDDQGFWEVDPADLVEEFRFQLGEDPNAQTLRSQTEGRVAPGREQTGDPSGRPQERTLTPLEGTPSRRGWKGPDAKIVAVAERYAADNDIDLRRQAEYVEVDVDRAERLAAAYDAMPHAPKDPAVREAYENLIHQTTAQYQALVEAGYEFYFGEITSDYFRSPYTALRELRSDKRMGVFPTTPDTFGDDATAVDDNPLLADTGITWKNERGEDQPVLANDLFRAVHDAFGHSIEGAGFRARGEENAWQAHARLFTGSALAALTSETRGQNSWLNYGPSGETNRTAKVEDTVFAEQKTGLMPEWTWTEGVVEDMVDESEFRFQLPDQQPKGTGDERYLHLVNTDNTHSAQTMVDAAAVEAGYDKDNPLHHGSTHNFTAFELGKVGVDNNFGRAFYFTSERLDALNNYATEEGPDITNRIERRAELLLDDDGRPEIDTMEEAQEAAREELVGPEPEGRMIHAYVRFDNAAVIGKDDHGLEARLDPLEMFDEDGLEEVKPEAEARVREDNDLEADADLGEFQLEVEEMQRELADENGFFNEDPHPAMEATQDVAQEFNDVEEDGIAALNDLLLGEPTLAQLEDHLRESVFQFATDEQGEIVTGEATRRVFEQMGYDGIIDRRVSTKFPNMDSMHPGVFHVIAFSPEQVKSSDPVTYNDDGTVIPLSERFDHSNADFRFQLSDDTGPILTDMSVTSAKNWVVDELRQMRDAGELQGIDPESWEEWMNWAIDSMASDPAVAVRLILEIEENPRVLNAQETALLTMIHRAAYSKFEVLSDQQFDAHTAGESAKAAELHRLVLMQTAWMDRVEEVARKTGSMAGAALNARKIALARDFTIENLLRRARSAQAGIPLERTQVEEMKQFAKRVAQLERRLNKKEAENRDLRSEVKRLLDKDIAEVEAEKKSKRRRRGKKQERKAGTSKTSAFAKLKSAALANGLTFIDNPAPSPEEEFRPQLADDDVPTLPPREGPSGLQDPESMREAANELAEVFVEDGVERFREFWAVVKIRLGEQSALTESIFLEAWNNHHDGVDITGELTEPGEISREARAIQRRLVENEIRDMEMIVEIIQDVMSDILPNEVAVWEALSKYGQFTKPSQDSASKFIRDMNAQLLQMTKLEILEEATARAEELLAEGVPRDRIADQLVEEGLDLDATGFVRDEQSDDVRRLNAMVNEAKKKLPVSPKTREGQLKSALATAKKVEENIIADLEWQIDNKQRILREKGVLELDPDVPEHREVIDLRARKAELRAEFKKMFPRQDMTDEQKEAMILRNLDRSIEEVERQIRENDVGPRPKKGPFTTLAIEAKKARLEHLREERNAIRDKDKVKLTPEERARRIYKANLNRRIADYTAILDSGDFSPRPPKKQRELSQEEIELKSDLEEIKKDVWRKMEEYRLKHASPMEKAVFYAKETVHLSRAFITSLDLSGLFRQGGLVVWAHPQLAKESAKAMTRALISKEAEYQSVLEIRNDPLGQFAETVGLAITEDGAKITKQEEAYAGRWASRVPIVRESGRAYSTMLNNLRFGLFKILVENLGTSGEVTIDEGKVIADFINVATGRSNIAFFKKHAETLNLLFFAPRWVASRFQYLIYPLSLYATRSDGMALWNDAGNTKRVRKLILKEMGRTIAGWSVATGAILAFAWLMSDEEDEVSMEANPLSTDFLKIKVGDTRIDTTSGLSSATVFSSRFLASRTKGADGKIRKFEDSYFGQSQATLLGRFMRYKMAPVPGAVWTALDNFTDPVGQKVSPWGLAPRLFIPLSIGEISDAMSNQNIPTGIGLSILALLGMSASTYGRLNGEQLRKLDDARKRNAGLRVFQMTNPGATEEFKTKAREQLGNYPGDWEEALRFYLDTRGLRLSGERRRKLKELE
jgi:hypothetical protein